MCPRFFERGLSSRRLRQRNAPYCAFAQSAFVNLVKYSDVRAVRPSDAFAGRPSRRHLRAKSDEDLLVRASETVCDRDLYQRDATLRQSLLGYGAEVLALRIRI